MKYIQKIDESICLVLSEKNDENNTAILKLLRNRELILLDFWRAFRSDELTHLQIEHVTVVEGQGLEIFIPHSKTDTCSTGVTYRVPVLNQLCPVSAYQDWIDASGLQSGAVFPSIDRWGNIKSQGLSSVAVRSMIKHYCKLAGLDETEQFRSHSLRRGFATWANANGWSLTDLMQYVGWKDVQSAMRYIESPDPFSKGKIERALARPIAVSVNTVPA